MLLITYVNDATKVKVSRDNIWTRDKMPVKIIMVIHPPSLIWLSGVGAPVLYEAMRNMDLFEE